MPVVSEHNNARSVISIPMRVGANGKILGVLQGMVPHVPPQTKSDTLKRRPPDENSVIASWPTTLIFSLELFSGLHGEPFKFSKHQAELMEPMLFMMTKVLERTQMSDNTLKLQTKIPKVFTARDIRCTSGSSS